MARGLIARAWLGASDAQARVGDFTMRPSQSASVRRIARAIASFGGALLADPPGTGKTVVALAVAQGAGEALVLAPASLRDHWQAFSARACVTIRFTSLESLSRGHRPTRSELIIVDEAHQVRTPGTRRYRVVASLCAGAHVLLLTATPVVNRRTDLDALLALFLGTGAPREEVLDRVLIRERTSDAPRPLVRALPALQGDADVPGLADALAALPPPLALEDGRTASALIRITLALAWQSSLAALDSALRRRVQRGAAVRDLMAAGRTPTRDALSLWTMDGDHTQLAIAELFGRDAMSCGQPSTRILDAHLDAVREIRRSLARRTEADTRARADALRALSSRFPTSRIALFARHAETIRALHREMKRDAGVVAVTGEAVRAAAGRWTRSEVLAAIGPQAAPLDPQHPRAIRILLATDLLSEGIEMQGVDIVVHADLPWTPARVMQRRGRITRVGHAGREVLEARFAAAASAIPLLRLGARLKRKLRAAGSALRTARAQAALNTTMREWSRLDDGPQVAVAHARTEGFVAAVQVDGDLLIIGGREPAAGEKRWTVTTRPTACAAITRAASGPERIPTDGDFSALRVGVAGIRHLLARRNARSALGADAGTANGVLQSLIGRLDAMLEAAPALERPAIAQLHRSLLESLGGRVEVGLELELRAILRSKRDDSELVHVLHEMLGRVRSSEARRKDPRDVRPRVVGLLLLRPAAPHAPEAPAASPSSTAPGTAAPR